MSRDTIRKAMQSFPKIEVKLYHHIAISTALQVIAQLPSYAGYAVDQLRQQLMQSHVRLVHPLSDVDGLMQFALVFVIHGRCEDQTTNRIYTGPALLPNSVVRIYTLPNDPDKAVVDSDKKTQRTLASDGDLESIVLFMVSDEQTTRDGHLYDEEMRTLDGSPPPQSQLNVTSRGHVSEHATAHRSESLSPPVAAHLPSSRTHWMVEESRHAKGLGGTRASVSVRDMDPEAQRSSLANLRDSLLAVEQASSATKEGAKGKETKKKS